MSESQSDLKKKRPVLDRLSLGFLIGFLILGIAAGSAGFYFVRQLINTWNLTSIPGVPEAQSPNPGAVPVGAGTGTPVPVQNIPLTNLGGPTPIPWDGVTRITMLVMGLDYRDWQDQKDIARTDSMILFTIDPISNTAGMLSIPRDLWVSIPGFDYGKINTAYFLGESFKVPGGGPALAVSTVEQLLGVPIQYYAQIDFNAFARFIDELGGLTINVKEHVTVSLVGVAGSFEIKPGVQTLDGPTALAYARNRYTGDDDFGRSKRQQDVIMAIRENILQVNMMPKLIAKAPALYQDLSSGIRTNMTLDQLIRLALLAQKIDTKSIKRGVIEATDVLYSKSPDGSQDILIQIPDKIRFERDKIFTVGGPVGPAAVGGDPAKLMSAEMTRISIQNGSQEAGLASKTAEYFKSMGLNVVEQTNADQAYSSSMIIIYTGKPYTVKYLADVMKIPESQIFNRFNPDSQVDISVILGADWIANNNLPK
jgi:LCP family protein required for cell wall assembly